MKIIGIIPARYGSTRFPGKMLADMAGKPMLERVYERSAQAVTVDDVLIATDDERIMEEAARFGAHAIMTSPNHRSGTDRCQEAYKKSGLDADYIINIQGDEPFIHPEQIDECAAMLDGNTEIGTLIAQVNNQEVLEKPGEVFVTFNTRWEALYFSRSVIPHVQGQPMENWLGVQAYYKHVGMYAYRTDVLNEISKLEQSNLEKAESLEQLRWLENGYKIRLGVTRYESLCVDTPDDLAYALQVKQHLL